MHFTAPTSARIGRILTILLATIGGSIKAQGEDWRNSVGWEYLSREMGSRLPTGRGVGVSQVEAGTALNMYAPQAGAGTYSGSGDFAGKTFTAGSGTSSLYSHARQVALQLYGNNLSGERWSVASGVDRVEAHLSYTWLGSEFLTPYQAPPRTEAMAIQNHSWVAALPTNPRPVDIAEHNDWLRRLDYAIARDGFSCVVALPSNASAAVPSLLASAYNVISVGVSNGSHSRGGTPSQIDGPGRSKPDIVAPLDLTSFAAPAVSGAMAMLREEAPAEARKPEVLKAILLAAASKRPFPAWNRTQTRPLDSIFGAGQVDVANGHRILAGGRADAASTIPLAAAGWDFGAVPHSGASKSYRLSVPSGKQAAEVSIMLVWNRRITNASTTGFTPLPATSNLSLTLTSLATGQVIDRSDSPVDNLEHLWLPILTAGHYQISVAGDTATDFALAWRMDFGGLSPELSLQATPNGLLFTCAGLQTGTTYALEQTTDLSKWTPLRMLQAEAAVEKWSEAREGLPPKRFFRLMPAP